jgi:hypothetical protein
MQAVRGNVDPDEVYWWLGFGYAARPRSTGGGEGGFDPWNDDDDLAASRVPKRPPGGAGAAGAEAVAEAEDVEEVDVRDSAT